MFTEDLILFFDEKLGFAEIATYGSLTSPVIIDMPGEYIFGESQISNEYAITYPTGNLPGLKRGDLITVKSVAYTVRESPRLVEDGATTRAPLSK